MKTTYKIALACFVGGATCCAVALILTPSFWWLGILTGMAGGYLSYEFRETFLAFKKFGKKLRDKIIKPFLAMFKKLKKWTGKEHPIFYSALLLSNIFFYLTQGLLEKALYLDQKQPSLNDDVVLVFLFYIVLLALTNFIIILITDTGFETEHPGEPFLNEKNVSYKDYWRWIMKGLVEASKKMPKGIFMGVFIPVIGCLVFFICYLPPWIVAQFICILIDIYSKERILCAVNGVIGGTTSYSILISPSMSLIEMTTLIIFGGILGSLFGILNYRLISQKIFIPIEINFQF